MMFSSKYVGEESRPPPPLHQVGYLLFRLHSWTVHSNSCRWFKLLILCVPVIAPTQCCSVILLKCFLYNIKDVLKPCTWMLKSFLLCMLQSPGSGVKLHKTKEKQVKERLNKTHNCQQLFLCRLYVWHRLLLWLVVSSRTCKWTQGFLVSSALWRLQGRGLSMFRLQLRNVSATERSQRELFN